MKNRVLARLLLASSFVFPLAANAQGIPTQPVAQDATVFAVVNGKQLTVSDYDKLARESFRDKFYHGSPPESEVQQMLREVGQSMIDRILLAEEVDHKRVGPDEASVNAEIAKYERQYANSAMWAQQRGDVLPKLRAHLEEKSRLDVLEKQVKNVAASDDELRAFYAANQSLFTEPEKRKVSIILLRVEPSSTSEVWKRRTEEAQVLLESIRKGAGFEVTAKEKSDDLSKEKGGDLGYLHRGMLSEAIETELDKLKIGETGGPVASLEGVVLFRLDATTTSALSPFDAVKGRAKELFLREKSAKAWQDYLVELRSRAKVVIAPAFTSLMSTASADKPLDKN